MPESGLNLEWALKNLEFRTIEQHPTYGPLLEQLLVKRFNAKMSATKIAELYRFPATGVRRVLRNAGVVLSPKRTPNVSGSARPKRSEPVTPPHDVPSVEPVTEPENRPDEPFSPTVSDDTLQEFAKGIGDALRAERRGRGWTRKDLRCAMGIDRSLQTFATHELGTRAISVGQFAEYCFVFGVQPGLIFDRVYHEVFRPSVDDTVIIDLDKLAVSEHPNLARWARGRRNEYPASSPQMLALPVHAQDTLAALCGFDRRQLLEALSVI